MTIIPSKIADQSYIQCLVIRIYWLHSIIDYIEANQADECTDTSNAYNPLKHYYEFDLCIFSREIINSIHVLFSFWRDTVKLKISVIFLATLKQMDYIIYLASKLMMVLYLFYVYAYKLCFLGF